MIIRLADCDGREFTVISFRVANLHGVVLPRRRRQRIAVEGAPTTTVWLYVAAALTIAITVLFVLMHIGMPQ